MSNPSDSDISSFAEWETQNPAQSLTEREQSLLDMKDPARVWGDRDSSNDARSSDGESASEVKRLSQQKGGVVGGGSKGRRLQVPSSTQGTESQLLSQNIEFDAPPSSQPRPPSSTSDEEEIEDEESQDNGTLGINDSLLSTVTNSPRTAHDLLQIKTSVQDFAVEHPFWTKLTLDEDEALEFEDDVFEFAKAAGLSANLAKVEVMRAMGAWKASKGIPVAQAGDITSSFEKVLETIEVVTDVIGSGQKKRKREEKDIAIPTPASINNVEGNKEVEIKEPKAKRQRRRERKRKIAEEAGLMVDTIQPAPGKSEAVGQTKRKEAESKRQRRRGKKRHKLEEEFLKLGEVIGSIPGSSDSAKEVMTAEAPIDPEIQLEREPEKKDLDQAVTTAPVAVSKPKVKSAKRIKNEKKKEKKRRAKQGPTTSSYFTKPDLPASAKLDKDHVIEEKAIVPTHSETEDAPMTDPVEHERVPADENNTGKEDPGHCNGSENKEQKRKRRKKRNKNRLPVAETVNYLKIDEERAPRNPGRLETSNTATLQALKPAAADDHAKAEPSAKKKRVRSRNMKADQRAANGDEKANALKPLTDKLPASKETSKDVLISPKVNKSSDDTKASSKSLEGKLIARPMRTSDGNGVFGPPDIDSADAPQMVIERLAIEPAPATEKFRKRKKNSETEVELKGEVTANKAATPEESEPPKKKPRDRNRKSINKILDAQMTALEKPAAQPLVELPDVNSEKKHKRDKSKKRSSVSTEGNTEASKEASNSSHS